MHDFTPFSALIGGALVGVAASVYLVTQGRVAGISGILGGALHRATTGADRAMRLSFLAGLIVVGVVVRMLFPAAFASNWSATWPLTLVAGLLVGVGTQLGNGCTSGHGVCGLSRLSVRSLAATVTFMATGFITVFVVRHLLATTR